MGRQSSIIQPNIEDITALINNNMRKLSKVNIERIVFVSKQAPPPQQVNLRIKVGNTLNDIFDNRETSTYSMHDLLLSKWLI